MGIHNSSAESKASKIIDLYNEGYSIDEIIKETDANKAYVKSTLLTAGLPIETGQYSKKFQQDFEHRWNKARLRIINSKNAKKVRK